MCTQRPPPPHHSAAALGRAVLGLLQALEVKRERLRARGWGSPTAFKPVYGWSTGFLQPTWSGSMCLKLVTDGFPCNACEIQH